LSLRRSTVTVWLVRACVEPAEPAVRAVRTRFGAAGFDAEGRACFGADGSVGADAEPGVRPDSSGALMRPSCSAVSPLGSSGVNSPLV
jgi:hypothetical protein